MNGLQTRHASARQLPKFFRETSNVRLLHLVTPHNMGMLGQLAFDLGQISDGNLAAGWPSGIVANAVRRSPNHKFHALLTAERSSAGSCLNLKRSCSWARSWRCPSSSEGGRGTPLTASRYLPQVHSDLQNEMLLRNDVCAHACDVQQRDGGAADRHMRFDGANPVELTSCDHHVASPLPVPLMLAATVRFRFSTLAPKLKATELFTVSVPAPAVFRDCVAKR